MQRITWTAIPVLLALAPASNAQSVGYEEALRAATSDQPQVRTSELRLDARREIADAADELPDPRLRAGIQNLPVSGPAAFELGRQLPTQIQVGIEQEIPNLAKRSARPGSEWRTPTSTLPQHNCVRPVTGYASEQEWHGFRWLMPNGL